MRPWTSTATALLFALPVATLSAQNLPALRLEPVAAGLDSPVSITHAGDGRLFVTEQAGRVVIVRDGQALPQPFLDIRSLVSSGGERGLLSVAFHPRYAQNGLFFVNYTDRSGDTVIARYRRSATDPDRADPASAVTLLTFDQPFANHNGGQLQFGPGGLLFIGTGDGGSGNDPLCNAQNRRSPLGKMLRIDVDGTGSQSPFFAIPAGNLPAGPGEGPGLVWAEGLRNPWRFSFDRGSGDLYIADVGQNAREEIDFLPAGSPAGANFGWNTMEGTLCLGANGCSGNPPCNAPQYTPPILEYANTGADCAVVGGYVYRGVAIPGLAGTYLLGDFCSGRLRAGVRDSGTFRLQDLGLALPGLTSFGENAQGEVFLVDQGGRLFRLAGTAPPPPPVQPGVVDLLAATAEVAEGSGTVILRARRRGGDDGRVTVRYDTADESTRAGRDYQPATGVWTWEDGDSTERTVVIALVDDGALEVTETFRLVLSDPTGGVRIGAGETQVQVTDDDLQEGSCAPGATTLCLQQGRFQVELEWETAEGPFGRGQAVPLTPDSGYFWFFDATNVEVIVKVLDACVPFEHYWVFAAGLTNVGTQITVGDLAVRQVRRYDTVAGPAFPPRLDTAAFATCP
jgi:glucose/arabinose dehydrogenase